MLVLPQVRLWALYAPSYTGDMSRESTALRDRKTDVAARSGDKRDASRKGLLALEQRQVAELAQVIGPRSSWRRELRRTRGREGMPLAQSETWLERLYAEGTVVREKKALVIDTRRSAGAYLHSIDRPPRVLLDACSQIATNTHGLSDEAVIRGLHEGRFDHCLWSNPTMAPGVEIPELRAYERALLERAPAGLCHASFVCAGGAEANEKALRCARLQLARAGRLEGRDRVLAFKDGFHGRTFSALMATWNPAKRGPFELPGYQALFADRNIVSVREILDARGSSLCAVIIEPMMAEGGDVHLPPDFFRELVAIVRAHGIPIIVDEVQTGMGTGGDYYWWSALGLGEELDTAPDYLTLAKKAGLGVVLARLPDPEPDVVNVASALRGLIAFERADEQWPVAAEIEARLARLTESFPQLVQRPRQRGVAFAFDLPEADQVKSLIARRFHHDYMTYPAGERTIRFRLGAGWGQRELDALFARLEHALAELRDGAGSEKSHADSSSHDVTSAPPRERVEYEVTPLREEDWPSVWAIEEVAYESARSASREELANWAERGIALVARRGEEVLGFCFGGPLEIFAEVDGPRQDRTLGTGTTFYSADVTVSQSARGAGIGRTLKQAQLAAASEAGYRWVTGRNRVGAADDMAELNRSLGAYRVARYHQQYGGDGSADYYRIALCDPDMPRLPRAVLDCRSGYTAPFGGNPEFMRGREFEGPLASKLNLSNWATPDLVHYVEHLRRVLPPGTNHVYFTSSRDETLDKGLRCLRLQRSSATQLVGLEGGFAGTTTAAARSISDPRGFEAGFGWFDWPLVPHPNEAGIDATIAALHACVEQRGADAMFGLYVEVVGLRSGHYLCASDAQRLAESCRDLGIPFIVAEHGSGYGRSGDGLWACEAWSSSAHADMVLWHTGGQLGHVFVSDAYWVDTPLALISTWDGDEVSMLRTHQHLRQIGSGALGSTPIDLRAAIETVAPATVEVRGRGAFVGLSFTDVQHWRSFVAKAEVSGLAYLQGLPQVAILCPRLDLTTEELERELLPAISGALECR